MSHNNLSTISVAAFGGLVSLNKLDLSHNYIERKDNGTQCFFEDNLSLDTLDLSHNQIGSITTLTFPSKQWTPYRLREINLSYNSLYLITREILIGTQKVKVLNLSSNHITEIRTNILGNLSSLEELDLSSNSLGYLDGRTIGPPPNLKVLSLNRNRLRKFPTEILPRAPFTLLNLMNNNLISFDLDFMSKIQNGSRDLLNSNPLMCDCRLIPLIRFYNNFRPKLSNFSADFYQDYFNFQCNRQSSLEIEHVSTLDESQLICDSTKDPLAPTIPRAPDVEFRNLVQKGNVVELRWRVMSRRDVTSFKLIMEDWNNEEVWTQTYMYNMRSAKLVLQPGTKQICIRPNYSRFNITATKVCQTIDSEGILPLNLVGSSTSSMASTLERTHSPIVLIFWNILLSLIHKSYHLTL